MLLTIISFLLVIAGIIMLIIGAVHHFVNEVISLICTIIVIGLLASFIVIIALLRVQIPKQADYDMAVMERESLIFRLSNNSESIQGNELLYSDILEFNKKVYSAKKWSKNIWVSWFNNEKIAELDYIDIYESEE